MLSVSLNWCVVETLIFDSAVLLMAHRNISRLDTTRALGRHCKYLNLSCLSCVSQAHGESTAFQLRCWGSSTHSKLRQYTLVAYSSLRSFRTRSAGKKTLRNRGRIDRCTFNQNIRYNVCTHFLERSRPRCTNCRLSQG